jgi:hypothetical protein
MKIITVLIFAISFAYSEAYSQEWGMYSTDGELKIEYKKVECVDIANGIYQEKVLFRYTNLTEREIEKDILVRGTYNNKGKVYQTQPDVSFKLSLPGGKRVEGTCDEKEKALCLFSRMLDIESSQLLEFEVKLK